jgi:hypothetical protein
MTAFAISSDTAPARRDNARIAGRALTGLVVAFLILDGAIKLVPVQPVIDTLAAIGWPNDVATARGLGVLLLALVALHLIPRTSLIGAVLLTGYLGGAIATHARIGSPLFSHTLFGVYVGILLWAGLYLRDAKLRTALS